MIPVYRFASKNGIFDYKRNIMQFLQGNTSVLYQFAGPKIEFRKIFVENA